ncbi:unnamed protein product [Discosporangium mesarthrocarpum]
MFLMAGMSEGTAWRVLHKLCECFSQHMFETWTGLPKNEEELQQTMEAYHHLGFTGAVWSTDVTHLSWNKCPVVDTRSHKGKEGFPLWRTRSPSTIPCVWMNERFTDLEYTLFDPDGNEYTHREAQLIVDSGYHQWECLVAPYKASSNEDKLQ